VNRSARASLDLLDRIVQTKREEIERLIPRLETLRRAARDQAPARGFRRALGRSEEVTVIAEFKRRSPSAGELRPGADPVGTARAYSDAGAAALSVLTDEPWFGGTLQDLERVRAAVGLPVLRKDFVLHPVQIWEARAAGADATLLIARILDDAQMVDLLGESAEAGLDVLVEVHDAAELERALAAGAGTIGVNNRDLATFATDVRLSLNLAASVPAEVVLVAESGIRTAAEVDVLGEAGVDAILVGETLMRAGPGGVAAAGLFGRPRRARPATAP
jgi:indole-3-glycerol phosphate synthase